MNIQKTSQHYKFINKFTNVPMGNANICQYIRRFIAATLMATIVYTTSIFLIVGAILIPTAICLKFFGIEFVEIAGEGVLFGIVFAVGGIEWVVLIISGLVFGIKWLYRRAKNKVKKSIPHIPQDNLMLVWLKSIKEKTCILVKYV